MGANFYVKNYSKIWNKQFKGDFNEMKRYFNNNALEGLRHEFKAYCLYVLSKKSLRLELKNNRYKKSSFMYARLNTFLDLSSKDLDSSIWLTFSIY